LPIAERTPNPVITTRLLTGIRWSLSGSALQGPVPLLGLQPLVNVVPPEAPVLADLGRRDPAVLRQGVERRLRDLEVAVKLLKGQNVRLDGVHGPLPGSGPMVDILSAQVKCFGIKNLWRFGTSANCDVRIVNWETAITGSSGTFDIRGQRVEISAPVSGMHWSEVFAAVMASAVAAGLDPQQVAQDLRQVRAPDGRGTLSELPLAGGGVAILVDDSYNANPASMKAALDTLSRFNAPRKLAVLGQMLELGPTEARLHSELSWPIEQAGICKVWCVGELMGHLAGKLPLHRQAIVPDDIDNLANSIYAELQDGDILLVKGSNGSGVHRVAKGLLQIAMERSKEKGRN